MRVIAHMDIKYVICKNFRGNRLMRYIAGKGTCILHFRA